MMRPIRYKEVPAKPKKAAKTGTKSQRATAGKAGDRMWYQKGWGIALIILIVAGGIVGLMAVLIMTGVIPNPFSIAPTPPPAGEYSISVWDGALNKELDSASFDYDLYGTNTSDWSDFDLIESGTDLSDISETDITTPDNDNWYSTYWVRFDGVQAHDDDIYGDDHNRGPRTYGERWAVIKNGQANNLITYETPNVVAMVLLNDQDISDVITTLGAGEMLVGKNVTIVIALNASQPEAMFVPYYDPQIEDDVTVTLRFQGNGAYPSLVKGDFKVAGSSGDVSGATSEYATFDLGSLMPGTTLLSGIWSGPTIGGNALEMLEARLFWGGTSLFAIT